jgi:hypothetical protein
MSLPSGTFLVKPCEPWRWPTPSALFAQHIFMHVGFSVGRARRLASTARSPPVCPWARLYRISSRSRGSTPRRGSFALRTVWTSSPPCSSFVSRRRCPLRSPSPGRTARRDLRQSPRWRARRARLTTGEAASSSRSNCSSAGRWRHVRLLSVRVWRRLLIFSCCRCFLFQKQRRGKGSWTSWENALERDEESKKEIREGCRRLVFAHVVASYKVVGCMRASASLSDQNPPRRRIHRRLGS